MHKATQLAVFLLCVALPGSAVASDYKVLHEFAGAPNDGDLPFGPVAAGKGGVLYGTTEYGGNGPSCVFEVQGCGTVFSLTPPASAGGTWTEAVLYNFTGGADGGIVYAGLAIGDDGVLYGATMFGGSGSCSDQGVTGCGVVFSLTPPASTGGAWTETVLHSFTGAADGSYPNGVIVANNGVLYGTAQDGGTRRCLGGSGTLSIGCGTAFAMTPAATGGSWSFEILHEFSSRGPNAPLASLMSSGGVIYGTSYFGGTGGFGGFGTVFSLTPPKSKGASWTESVLYNFKGPFGDGANPSDAVVMGSDGVLYGTTQGGGSGECSATGVGGCGAVFSLSPPTSPGSDWSEAVLYSFNTNGRCSNGDTAYAGVAVANNGVLYGTTDCGGAPNRYGEVYSLTPPGSAGADWSETTLHSYVNAANGGGPYANVVIGKDGVLYGTTNGGGTNGGGTVFSLKP